MAYNWANIFGRAMTCVLSLGVLESQSFASEAIGFSESSASLELNISGTISPRCEIEITAKHIELDFSSLSGKQDIPVRVDCNEVMDVVIQSRNGGFLLETGGGTPPVSNSFTPLITYEAEFSVAAPGAQPVSVKSEVIHGVGRGGSVKVIPFQSPGNLSLSWSSEKHPYGGRYSDVIEIRTSSKGR